MISVLLVETSQGWISSIRRFKTENDAIACGRKYVSEIGGNELSREFEVYKDFRISKKVSV